MSSDQWINRQLSQSPTMGSLAQNMNYSGLDFDEGEDEGFDSDFDRDSETSEEKCVQEKQQHPSYGAVENAEESGNKGTDALPVAYGSFAAFSVFAVTDPTSASNFATLTPPQNPTPPNRTPPPRPGKRAPYPDGKIVSPPPQPRFHNFSPATLTPRQPTDLDFQSDNKTTPSSKLQFLPPLPSTPTPLPRKRPHIITNNMAPTPGAKRPRGKKAGSGNNYNMNDLDSGTDSEVLGPETAKRPRVGNGNEPAGNTQSRRTRNAILNDASVSSSVPNSAFGPSTFQPSTFQPSTFQPSIFQPSSSVPGPQYVTPAQFQAEQLTADQEHPRYGRKGPINSFSSNSYPEPGPQYASQTPFTSGEPMAAPEHPRFGRKGVPKSSSGSISTSAGNETNTNPQRPRRTPAGSNNRTQTPENPQLGSTGNANNMTALVSNTSVAGPSTQHARGHTPPLDSMTALEILRYIKWKSQIDPSVLDPTKADAPSKPRRRRMTAARSGNSQETMATPERPLGEGEGPMNSSSTLDSSSAIASGANVLSEAGHIAFAPAVEAITAQKHPQYGPMTSNPTSFAEPSASSNHAQHGRKGPMASDFIPDSPPAITSRPPPNPQFRRKGPAVSTSKKIVPDHPDSAATRKNRLKQPMKNANDRPRLPDPTGQAQAQGQSQSASPSPDEVITPPQYFQPPQQPTQVFNPSYQPEAQATLVNQSSDLSQIPTTEEILHDKVAKPLVAEVESALQDPNFKWSDDILTSDGKFRTVPEYPDEQDPLRCWTGREFNQEDMGKGYNATPSSGEGMGMDTRGKSAEVDSATNIKGAAGSWETGVSSGGNGENLTATAGAYQAFQVSQDAESSLWGNNVGGMNGMNGMITNEEDRMWEENGAKRGKKRRHDE